MLLAEWETLGETKLSLGMILKVDCRGKSPMHAIV